MSNTNVQRLAKKFLSDFGPMTAASAAMYAKMHKEGKISIPDTCTNDDLRSALELVNVISYKADINAYETGGTEADPAKGVAILADQALRSPSTQSEISAMLNPEHEYSVAVAADQAATIKSNTMTESAQNAAKITKQFVDDNIHPSCNRFERMVRPLISSSSQLMGLCIISPAPDATNR